MKPLALKAICSFLFATPTLADVPHGNWTEAGVLAECDYCRTDEFHQSRLQLANQVKTITNYAGASGYAVIKRVGKDDRVGRISLFGLGNLATTVAHVLFDDNSVLRETDDGKIYFEPMITPGSDNYVEIDLESIVAGCRKTTGGVTKRRCDWAVFKLREDVLARVEGMYAPLWNFKASISEFNNNIVRNSMIFVSSNEYRRNVDRFCTKPQGPSPYELGSSPYELGYGSHHVFFHTCPSLKTVSGSSFYFTANDSSIHLVAQHVAGEHNLTAPNGVRGPVPKSAVGLPEERLEAMNRLYRSELKVRGILLDSETGAQSSSASSPTSTENRAKP